MDEAQWVSVTSHRARERLARLVGELGPSYGRWPDKGWPTGEYYELPRDLVVDIKGVRVLRARPHNLFERWKS